MTTFGFRRGPASRRRATGLLAFWAIVVVVVGAVVVVWASPVLGLRTVEVSGADGGSAPAPSVAAEITGAVGVADGTPLVRIDLDAVRQRVGDVPAVASATVTREWPHSLAIAVTLRQPVATTQANGSWWLLDASGTPFGEQAAQPSGLMPIKLATPGPTDRATTAAIDVAQSLAPELRAKVLSMAAPSAYQISLRLADGRVVLWGDDSEAAAKNAVVPVMLQQPGQRFDVSDPTLVTVRGQ